jgi:hypothetical protein
MLHVCFVQEVVEAAADALLPLMVVEPEVYRRSKRCEGWLV